MKTRTLDLLRQEVATSSPPVEIPAEEVLLANSARTTEVPPKTTEEIIKQKEIEHREYLRRVHFLMGLVTGTIEDEDSETTASRSTLQKFIEAEENGIEEDNELWIDEELDEQAYLDMVLKKHHAWDDTRRQVEDEKLMNQGQRDLNKATRIQILNDLIDNPPLTISSLQIDEFSLSSTSVGPINVYKTPRTLHFDESSQRDNIPGSIADVDKEPQRQYAEPPEKLLGYAQRFRSPGLKEAQQTLQYRKEIAQNANSAYKVKTRNGLLNEDLIYIWRDNVLWTPATNAYMKQSL